MILRTILMAGLLGTCAVNAWGTAANPDQTPLRKALEKHLSKEGNVCLGKFDWPIDVSEQDFKLATRDARQMPVLEKLGLVSSSDASVQRVRDEVQETVAVKRYQLTDAGRKFYIDKDEMTEGVGGGMVEHHKDFCAVKLRLDKIIRADETTATDNTKQATLTYTYRVVTAASWIHDPEAQKVFPMIDRVIKGERNMELEQRMRLGKDGWVAVGRTD